MKKKLLNINYYIDLTKRFHYFSIHMDQYESSDMPISTSPVYAFINDYVTPSIDSELKKFEPNFGNQDKYRLISMIGKGKYSIVFSAVAVKPKQSQNIQPEIKSTVNDKTSPNKKLYAIKILKDVPFTRIKRELYILKRVSAAEPFPMTINYPESQLSNIDNDYNTLSSNIKPSSIEDFTKYDQYSQFPSIVQPSSFSVPINSLADVNFFNYNMANAYNYNSIKNSTSTSDTFSASSSNYDSRYNNNNNLSEGNKNSNISNLINEKENMTESVVHLYDVIRDDLTGIISIVTDYVEANPPKHLYPTLSLDDIRYYMYRLLTALDICHSRGVMHRDIKPGNVLISKSFDNDDNDKNHNNAYQIGQNQSNDHIKRSLTIIDWGLAELYYPMKRYPTRVATMRYKAPELLLGYPFYDYGVDIWGAGCMMLEMLFEFGFIKGLTNPQVLFSIAKIWGKSKIQNYASRYKLENSETYLAYQEMLSKTNKCSDFDSWAESVALRMRPSVRDSDALDLLKKLLEVDHGERITARDALRHRFFLPLFKSNPREYEKRIKMNMEVQMNQKQYLKTYVQIQKKRKLF